ERAQALDRVEITSMKREAPSRSAPGIMRRGSDASAANAAEASAERAQALDRVEITSMKREAPSRSAPGIMRRGSDA
ncbi:hypothetical protein C7E15_22950, partial [Stenotrophomonas maltophilia]